MARLHSLIVFLSVCAAANSAAAAKPTERFPYKAHVNREGVYLRSGPGQEYYPVSKTQVGDLVEVYRHDPGDWYAVRPPAGSFSWIRADFIAEGEKGSGVVTGDRVVARVGTEFSDKRDVIQVRLNHGEHVRILESKEIADGNTVYTWYKIAPPSGEFRWIHGIFLDPEPDGTGKPSAMNNLLVAKHAIMAQKEADARLTEAEAAAREMESTALKEFEPAGAATEAPAATASAASAAPSSELSDAPRFAASTEAGPNRSATAPAAPADAPASSGWVKAARKLAAVGSILSQPGGSRETKLQSQMRGAPPAMGPVITGSDSIAVAIPAEPAAPGTFEAQWQDVDLQLSRIVASDPSHWQLGELHAAASRLQTTARNASQRAQAQQLVKRIARFEQIQAGYQGIARTSAEEPIAVENRTPAAKSDSASGSAAEPWRRGPSRMNTLNNGAARGADARKPQSFDGQGKLIRVALRGPDSPQYALVDEAGKVRTYVTPSPGLNLRPYLGQQVGITGEMGYLGKHEAQLLTAQHVQFTNAAAASRQAEKHW